MNKFFFLSKTFEQIRQLTVGILHFDRRGRQTIVAWSRIGYSAHLELILLTLIKTGYRALSTIHWERCDRLPIR